MIHRIGSRVIVTLPTGQTEYGTVAGYRGEETIVRTSDNVYYVTVDKIKQEFKYEKLQGVWGSPHR